MLKNIFFPGYNLDTIINSGVTTNIYRGTTQQGNTTVIIKLLKNDNPSIEAIARLKHEFSIAENLEHENIVKILRLETHDQRQALIFEDFDGISLKQHLTDHKASLQLILQVAIAVTQSLVYIHSRNIIHKDIKPGNIIINHTTGKIKLTDFSISSRLSKETTQQINPSQLEGTLAYISPEQTGRMNRNIDYRSDFYSLGVTLYEMLTQQLPFNSNDPLELVSAHIATEPIPIQQLNPDIPSTVCAIVKKLMAKNAEDRYQSAKGLLLDLEQCLQQLQATGNITNFTPGSLEVLSVLLVPEKLYGREQQVKLLLEAGDRVAKGKTELILVSGYSGIGKTSVINELNKSITKTKGYFISGKFDQFQRDIPYAALIQAFSSLCRQILTESSAQLEIWRHKIQKAVGDNGQVIIDVIPEVELIIAIQPEIPQLEPIESQNRFHRVFQQFVSVLSHKEHPLIVFLDDLQWADSATLHLMQLLMTDVNIECLLLIGAYRDNEVSATHPLINTIEEIEKTYRGDQLGVIVNNIVLQPLSLDSVSALVAESLNDKTGNSNSLAELIFHKTAGNPFFITQLLQVLHQESLLTFDFQQQKWLWDTAEILAIGITDKSIVDLVASRIEQLPETTQQVLKLAACIGDKFTLDVLSLVNQKSIHDTANQLDLALQASLILPLNQAYRIPLLFSESDIASFDSKQISYKFLHDRVQQAAYSLIPDSNKQITHLRIGQILRASSSERFADNILEIVNQLNFGVELLKTDEEKYELANLNLIAGKKAKNNAAFAAAVKYLNVGLKLLVENSWQSHYDLTLELYVETAEAEYLTGAFHKSHELVNISLMRCKNILDKTKLYGIQIQSYTAKGEILDALDVGIIALKNLGLKLPNQPNLIHVLVAFAQTRLTLLGRKVENLAYLPDMKDAYKLEIMKMLMFISPVASQSGSLLFSLMILAMVRLSVKYGNSTFATYSYSLYGAILCDKLGNIKSGDRFGKLGIDLLSKMNAKSLKAKTYFTYSAMIKHFKYPVSESLPDLREGIKIGLETGDTVFTTYSIISFIQYLFFSNGNLELIIQEVVKYNELITNTLKNESYVVVIKLVEQTVLNLQGFSINKLMLAGDAFNELHIPDIISNNSTNMSAFCFFKAKICYLFGDYQAATKASEQVKKYQKTNPAFLIYLVNNFYYSLSLLANCKNISYFEKKLNLQKVKINQKKMKLWAFHAPCNFKHKYDLVEAEKARIFGQKSLAIDLYDRAIFGAKNNNYIAEEALANELAAKFYLELGKEKIARTYMIEAYDCYVRWGAFAKVRDLEEQYPNLIAHLMIPAPEKTVQDIKSSINSSSYAKSIHLDISTVLKASLILSSEIVLESFLEKLMYLVKENAGAQKVLFIAKHKNELVVEGSLIESGEITVLQSLPINQEQVLPISLINYVERTQTSVVLDDANSAEIFKNDLYIIAHQPKSVLASPIIHQGKLTGILYLENNLTTQAFTKDRLEVLQVLSAQAAVSLENARFYSTLESRVQERTQQLQAMLQELQRTQSQLIHNEKMSSLGQLVAGIAHEINNPINFIDGNLTHTSTYIQSLLELIDIYQESCHTNIFQVDKKIQDIDLDYIKEDIPKLLASMKTGATRIRDIVKSLRTFSRLDEAEMKDVDIHQGIDSTLMILLEKIGTIQIVKEYGELPKINCYARDLNQVFLHLLTNAIDALSERVSAIFDSTIASAIVPTIRVSTEVNTENQVVISITDNGVGMNDDIKSKIFDPFFTTKSVGKGTGIGLSISYQVITQKHHGTLECISSIGEGTTFIIRIPF